MAVKHINISIFKTKIVKMRTNNESIEKRNKIDYFIDILLQWNNKFNLTSSNITKRDLEILVGETILLCDKLYGKMIMDAGSGNGLIGIPIAINNPKKRVILVEKLKKKSNFLTEVKKSLDLSNVDVVWGRVEDYLLYNSKIDCIVTRGFPNLDILVKIFLKRKICKLLAITSRAKIEKKENEMENIKKCVYNIPNREKIVLCIWSHVSRETIGKS